MKVTKNIEEARELLDKALEAMNEEDDAIQALPDTAPEETRKFHEELFETRKSDVADARKTLERLIALRDARETVPAPDSDDGDGDGDAAETRQRIQLGKEPRTYRKEGQNSFFRDLYHAQIGQNPEAMARLAQHHREVEIESRSMSTTVTAGGNFIPPEYLGEMYAPLARAGRPFADAVPSSPLMAEGMTITIPRITTGTLVATQTTQNTSLGTQDIVEALLSVPVVTIGGYADLSVQLAERASPAFDQILFNDLRADYDRLLDNQLINGTGTTQHVGIRSVASINTSTYTSGTPTAAGLVPKVYDAIQLIASNRYAPPDLCIMHPRRAAFLASNLSSTFPLFQYGQLTQAVGVQDQGMTTSLSGLRIINDANIATNYSVGGNTNEDEMYVVRSTDFHLWEGQPRVEVFRDVGSATGTVRIRLYAFSAFASGRFPKSITKIAGSGLSTPSF